MLTLETLLLRQDSFELSADWSLPAGERLALIGPSGAGKSTLLAGIAGFLAPARGRVLWQGRDLTAEPPGHRPIAMLFQDGNLFPHLSVERNVGLGIRPDLKLGDVEREAVRAAIHRVGLAGMEGRKPGSLSGGQQSRAALARVMVMQRPVLLLDEPFAALGPAMRAEMLDFVAQMAGESGATVIMVSHDPGDALRIAGLTSVVADGTVSVPKDTTAVFADPPEALRDYLG